MNVFTRRVLPVSLAAIIFLYIIFHVFFTSSKSVQTETAIMYTVNDSISSNAYIVRDEVLVYNESENVLNYSVENGQRVAKGGVVATEYASEDSVEAKNKVDLLNQQIENLKSLQKTNTTIVTDISRLDKQISESLVSMLTHAVDGDLSQLAADSDKHLTLINRRLIATGGTADYSNEIARLEKKVKALKKKIGTKLGQVKSPCAGYFISAADGYEKTLTSETVKTLTPENFDSVKRDDAVLNDKNIAGKIVSNFDWYIAVKVSYKDSMRFEIGDSANVEMPLSTTSQLPVTVSAISRDKALNKAVVVFTCDYMNSELASIRTQPIEIIINTYNGLYVNSAAIRNNDGANGVYVLEGSKLKFKAIDILYTGSGYVIAKSAQSSKSGLFLYDEIVVKGKNLYDGKPVSVS